MNSTQKSSDPTLSHPFTDGAWASAALDTIDPLFAELAGSAAGAVWARPALTQRERAFLSIAANVCNQTLDEPFKIHVELALEGGATIDEIREVLLHMAIYGSFPKALQAFKALSTMRSGSVTSGAGHLPTRAEI